MGVSCFYSPSAPGVKSVTRQGLNSALAGAGAFLAATSTMRTDHAHHRTVRSATRLGAFFVFLLVASTVAEAGPAAMYGLGFAGDGHKIYRVDLELGTATLQRTLGTRDPAPNDGTSPNALALDSLASRFFYTVTRNGAADDELYSVPTTGSAGPRLHGKLRGNVRAAVFHAGKYLYARNGAATLRAVAFNPAGAILEDIPLCRNFTGHAGDFRFGDLTVQGHLLWGTFREATSRRQYLFSLELAGCIYTELEIANTAPPQILLGTDGALYAHDHVSGTFTSIDPSSGVPLAAHAYAPLVRLADLAGPSPSAGVRLVTRTNGGDHPAPDPGPLLSVGSPVEWTYEVTNTGAVPLTQLVVTDDRLADDATLIDCDGDNVLSALAAGASAVCRASGVVEPGPYVNVGTVTTQVGGAELSASDDDRYLGYQTAAFLIIDDDTFGAGLKYNRNGGNVVSTSSFWTTRDLGEPEEGKRNELPYAEANRGRVITLVTGAVNARSGSSSGRGNGRTSGEGWFAPQCIPPAWLGRAPMGSGACLEGAERAEALQNFVLMGQVPWLGAASSNTLPPEALQAIDGVLPLRARGLAALKGRPVCAVVYDDDLETTYSESSAGASTALDSETLGIVAFEVLDARTRTCAGSNTWCLPEVSVKLLDPAGPCGAVGLFNAPVPRSASVPTDTMVIPVFSEVGTMGYWSLEFASGLGPVY